MTNDADPDEYVEAIAPHILVVLTRIGFFKALDNILSPSDGSKASRICAGDCAISEELLGKLEFEEADREDIFEVLRSRGGFCDCEVLYNVAEISRLKANYWRARADGAASPNPHRRRPTR
jgi:hypothetical protein